MEKLLFGTGGMPLKTKPRNYDIAFGDLVEMKLGCMELEFVHGVSMNSTTQQMVRQVRAEKNLVLTAHAPYYINLNSPEEEKIDASVKRILDTARATSACGGYSITFHAAFYMGADKETVYKKVKTKMTEIVDTLKAENIDIWVRPELTGKATQWGDLDEVIQISKDLEMVLPVIDFAHLHARTAGEWNTYDEFARVFERIGNEIGTHALENFHAHIAGIEYSAKGEKKHLILEESDMRYVELMKAFKDFNVKGVIICESPNLEEDALLMMKTYENL